MKSSEIKKYQSKSYSQLHATAKKWFNLFIKLRDTDELGIGYCIATGQMLKLGTESAQAGHYFAAGKYKTLEFNEDNVHLQSKQDNYFGHDFAAYTTNLIKKIGMERFEKLQFLAACEKQSGFKQDKFTIIDIIQTYKAKCKELALTKSIEI